MSRKTLLKITTSAALIMLSLCIWRDSYFLASVNLILFVANLTMLLREW